MTEANLGGLDPCTPVLAGAGQVSERLDEPGYQRRSAAGLAGDAARAALADTGAAPAAVAAAIDTVAGVRQFENSSPWARALLGGPDNYPRSVARRVGADPGRAVLEVSGGQAPQQELLATAPQPAGQRVYVRSAGDGNRVTVAGPG